MPQAGSGLDVVLGDLQDRDRALHALYKQKGKGPRHVMRALGWSSGKRGQSYSRNAVVCDYVMLLGRTPFRGMHRLVRKGSRLPPEEPRTPVEAVLEVAKSYQFLSAGACRVFLVRARREIRTENRRVADGSPVGLVDDFPIPDQVKLDRP